MSLGATRMSEGIYVCYLVVAQGVAMRGASPPVMEKAYTYKNEIFTVLMIAYATQFFLLQ